MRAHLLALPLAVAVSAGAVASCSSKSDGGTTTPLVDAGPATYAPQGCAYTIAPPDARGFTGLALDDAKATGDAPIRVRLGMGGATTKGKPGYADPTTTAAFTWETAATTNAAKVRLGNDPAMLQGGLSDVHTGYSWTTQPPSVGIGTNEAAAQMHEAHVCGLTPGKTYYYQVGGGSPEVWSATQSFTTVPSSGKITLGVSGDSRDSADILQLVQLRMRDAGVAMQLFSGDFVIFGAQESQYAQWIDKMWKDPSDASKFLTLGQQMILPVPGNHENDSSQFFGNWALPGDGAYAETFGSFDVGNAHVVLLDDELIAAVGKGDQVTAQLAWLEADLMAAEADRAAHPFIIVVHHRGELSTSDHGKESDVLAARTALLPIWDKHHVDLVLNGHDHNYERSRPVTGPASSPTVQTAANMGTTFVVCAGAGASAYSPGKNVVPYRAFNAGFGNGTPYVGVYALLTLEPGTLTLKGYGLKQAGGGVMGDDLLDTFTSTR